MCQICQVTGDDDHFVSCVILDVKISVYLIVHVQLVAWSVYGIIPQRYTSLMFDIVDELDDIEITLIRESYEVGHVKEIVEIVEDLDGVSTPEREVPLQGWRLWLILDLLSFIDDVAYSTHQVDYDDLLFEFLHGSWSQEVKSFDTFCHQAHRLPQLFEKNFICVLNLGFDLFDSRFWQWINDTEKLLIVNCIWIDGSRVHVSSEPKSCL